MPRFFAGLRLSLSLALVLMVFAELAGSSNGLGYEMNNAQSSFDMTWVWATIVLLALLGQRCSTCWNWPWSTGCSAGTGAPGEGCHDRNRPCSRSRA